MLAKSKLNSIKTLVSQALIDIDIKNLMRLLGRNKNMRGWKKAWGVSVKNKKIWDWIVLTEEK